MLSLGGSVGVVGVVGMGVVVGCVFLLGVVLYHVGLPAPPSPRDPQGGVGQVRRVVVTMGVCVHLDGGVG